MNFSLSILAFFITFCCYGQNENDILQQKARNEIEKLFSKSVVPKIQCESFYMNGMGHDDAYTQYDCSFSTDTTLKYFFYGFNYFFYSESLKDTFFFSIALDSNSIDKNDYFLKRKMPQCIRSGTDCGFISSDSITSIVNKKGYIFLTNRNTQHLEKNKIDGEFYWVIPVLRNENPYDIKTKTIIINMKTGNIIPRSKFSYVY